MMFGGNTNHILPYSALRGGISVHNPLADTSCPGGSNGTLGFVGTSDGKDRWIVSCYHVLCRMTGAFPNSSSEAIYHPFSQIKPTPVATVTDARADQNLDCAAALVHDGVPVQSDVLGIGRLADPTDPQLGRRVIKAGAETGVTEGVIVRILTDDVEIAPVFSASANYLLSAGGDSGALWVDASTYEPVALHYRGSDSPRRAFARKLLPVLAALRLSIAR
jgi:hypothetical protein